RPPSCRRWVHLRHHLRPLLWHSSGDCVAPPWRGTGAVRGGGPPERAEDCSEPSFLARPFPLRVRTLKTRCHFGGTCHRRMHKKGRYRVTLAAATAVAVTGSLAVGAGPAAAAASTAAASATTGARSSFIVVLKNQHPDISAKA